MPDQHQQWQSMFKRDFCSLLTALETFSASELYILNEKLDDKRNKYSERKIHFLTSMLSLM